MKRDEFIFIAVIYALIIGLGFVWPYLQSRLPIQRTGDDLAAASLLPAPVRLAHALRSPRAKAAVIRTVQGPVLPARETPLRYAHGALSTLSAKPVSQLGQPAAPRGTGNV